MVPFKLSDGQHQKKVDVTTANTIALCEYAPRGEHGMIFSVCFYIVDVNDKTDGDRLQLSKNILVGPKPVVSSYSVGISPQIKSQLTSINTAAPKGLQQSKLLAG